MYKKWEEYEVEYIKNNYSIKTNKEMSEYLGRTKTAIDLKINKLGLKKSKYNYNHKYFENIDTEEKAYWLGFIYADGYISRNEEKYMNEFGIELQKSDYKHLKKFNKSINGNINVSFRSRENIFEGYNKTYETCFIRIYSKEFVNNLIKNGVVENKSLKVTFPKHINNSLIRHFIRGFFDGDGCICESKRKNNISTIKCDFTCGSIEFVNSLREVLYKEGISSYIIKEENKPYRLVIGGLKNCDIFLHYIYDDSNIYLDRKYEKKNQLYKDLNIEQRLPL